MKTSSEQFVENMKAPLAKCPSCGHEFTPAYELEQPKYQTYQVTATIEVEASNPMLADELVATILAQAQAKQRIGMYRLLPSIRLECPSPIPPSNVTSTLRAFGGGIQAGLHR